MKSAKVQELIFLAAEQLRFSKKKLQRLEERKDDVLTGGKSLTTWLVL